MPAGRAPAEAAAELEKAEKDPSEGGMVRLETLIELKFISSSFSSLSSYYPLILQEGAPLQRLRQLRARLVSPEGERRVREASPGQE